MEVECTIIYDELKKYLNASAIDAIKLAVSEQLEGSKVVDDGSGATSFLHFFSLLNALYLIGALVAVGALSVFWRVAENLFGAVGSALMATLYFVAFYSGACALEVELFAAKRALTTCALAMVPFCAYAVARLTHLQKTTASPIQRGALLLMCSSTCAVGWLLDDDFVRLFVGWAALGTVWLALRSYGDAIRCSAMAILVALLLSVGGEWLQLSGAWAMVPIGVLFYVNVCPQREWIYALVYWFVHVSIDAWLAANDHGTLTLRTACALGAIASLVALARCLRAVSRQDSLHSLWELMGCAAAFAVPTLVLVAAGYGRVPVLAGVACVLVTCVATIALAIAQQSERIDHVEYAAHAVLFAFSVAVLSLASPTATWWPWHWLVVALCSMAFVFASATHFVMRVLAGTHVLVALPVALALALVSLASPALLALVYEAALVLSGITASYTLRKRRPRTAMAAATPTATMNVTRFVVALPACNTLLAGWAESHLVYWLAVAHWCSTLASAHRGPTAPLACRHLALAGFVAACIGALTGGSFIVFLGSAAIFAAVAIASHRIFAGSIAYPFIMLALGSAIIYMGVLSQRYSGIVDLAFLNRIMLTRQQIMDLI